jgi:hypothetical protein
LLQPVAGVQLSMVQKMPSSQLSAVPATHVPEALQVSEPLQRLASAQDVPSGFLPSVGQVVATPSQVSATSHTPLAARHSTPRLPAGWTQLPLPLHTSVVHSLPSSVQATPGVT